MNVIWSERVWRERNPAFVPLAFGRKLKWLYKLPSDFVDYIHVNTELTHTSLHVLYMHFYHMEMSVNKIIVFLPCENVCEQYGTMKLLFWRIKTRNIIDHAVVQNGHQIHHVWICGI